MITLTKLQNKLRRIIQPLIFDSEKEGWLVLALAATFILALTSLGLRPALSSTLRLRQEIARGRDAEKKMGRKIDNLNRAVVNVNNIRSDINLINQSLPENKDLPRILESLNSIFGNHNVTLSEIVFGGPRPTPDPNILIMPFSLKASGSYEGFLSVVEEIEKNPRQINFIKVVVEIPSKGDKRFLTISLDLETYFLKKIYT